MAEALYLFRDCSAGLFSEAICCPYLYFINPMLTIDNPHEDDYTLNNKKLKYNQMLHLE